VTLPDAGQRQALTATPSQGAFLDVGGVVLVAEDDGLVTGVDVFAGWLFADPVAAGADLATVEVFAAGAGFIAARCGGVASFR
jgi:hypothetical protein